MYSKPHDRLWEALFKKPRHDVLKVLKDISFNVGMGRSLGMIGDNGAGKSTLLKLVAGTIQPTCGTIEVNGRVAALLELGAGFHPEFTGRQNIHLNASLLGISEEEIRYKENEIIEFSELDTFIDRPVRTYSSGMYVRLAFSIATMVDPDILIIDEALAVGDMKFQRKCINRMNSFKKQGKTMLFCSHSMYHVQELCDHVLWLENGKIRKSGKSNEVVKMYEEFCTQKKKPDNNEQQPNSIKEAHEKECQILSFSMKSIKGKDIKTIKDPIEPVVLEMEIKVLADNIKPNFGFAVTSSEEEILGASLTNYDKLKFGPYSAGQKVVVRYTLDFFPVRVGSFMALGAVSEESGLLWYDWKYLGPVSVDIGKGMGTSCLKGSWDVIE